ncbi:VOC family protein [Sporosarcina gallistercoris]|uniref:VOC family protein n=1 Tax=Sporosarcina gallistercoris TaxID=2762245 RepID=UPI003D27BAA9
MEIKQVTLQASNIEEMKRFYTVTLGLKLVEDNENTFCIAVGSSKLEFTSVNAEVNPYYHFAFNIQGNRFLEAKSWVEEKVDLNIEDGDNEADFPHLSARSLYFNDPSGNVVEFIARHSKTDTGDEPFSPDSILNISEISLTVPDAIEVGKQLMKLGIKEREKEPLSATSLNFMGDPTSGVFILLVQPGRKWIFSDKISAVFPLEITLESDEKITLNNKN